LTIVQASKPDKVTPAMIPATSTSPDMRVLKLHG
jgi:hypothetical protein